LIDGCWNLQVLCFVGFLYYSNTFLVWCKLIVIIIMDTSF
jgi:hypothetical protein